MCCFSNFFLALELILHELNSPFIQETDNHQDACYSEDCLLHFLPCNYKKTTKKERIKFKKKKSFKSSIPP